MEINRVGSGQIGNNNFIGQRSNSYFSTELPPHNVKVRGTNSASEPDFINPFSSFLDPGERVIYNDQPLLIPYVLSSPIIFGFLGSWIGILLFILTLHCMRTLVTYLSMSFILVPIVLYLSYLICANTRYALTNKKIILRRDILGTNVIFIPYENVSFVALSTHPVEFTFRVGTLRIFSKNNDPNNSANRLCEDKLCSINDVNKIKKFIEGAVESVQEQTL